MIWEIGQDCFDGSISVQDSMYAYIEENNVGISAAEGIEFTVFPNPSDHVIYLKTPFELNAEYSLLNHLGQTVLEGKFTNGKSIDVSTLKSGIYYLELNDQKHNFKKTEIIKK